MKGTPPAPWPSSLARTHTPTAAPTPHSTEHAKYAPCPTSSIIFRDMIAWLTTACPFVQARHIAYHKPQARCSFIHYLSRNHARPIHGHSLSLSLSLFPNRTTLVRRRARSAHSPIPSPLPSPPSSPCPFHRRADPPSLSPFSPPSPDPYPCPLPSLASHTRLGLHLHLMLARARARTDRC